MAGKRTYNRDARGRFASGGGGGGGKGSKGGGGKPAAKPAATSKPAGAGRRGPRGGRVGTRAEQARAKKEQAKRQATFASKATAGREAKAKTKLARSQARATRRAGAASGIRRTGGLPIVKPASNIRRTSGPRRAPLGGARNAIRTFNPKTPQGKQDQALRQIGRAAKDLQSDAKKLKKSLEPFKNFKREIDRQTAREIVNAKKKGLDGEIARSILRITPSRMLRAGQDVIRSRAARARAAAGQGSKPAARALEIYGNQLAFTGSGKPSRSAKNKIVPGPRNANPVPPPKPKRKPRANPKPKSSAKPKPKPSAKSKPLEPPANLGSLVREAKKLLGEPKPAAKPKAKPKATAKPKAPEKGGAIIKRPSSAIVRQQPPAPAPAPAPRPSAQNRPGSITSTLRGMLGSLAKLDAARAREIENITGKPIPVPKRTAKPRIPGGSTGNGSVTGTMRGAMRGLAQSDAQFIREVQSMIGPSAPKSLGGKGGKSKGSLPASKPPSKPRKRKPKPKA